MVTKICNKCEVLKKLSEYHKDKTHKDGHRSTCKECIKKYTKEYNDIKYPNKKPKLTPEEIKENRRIYFKKYYENNKERLKKKAKQWYLNNPDKVKTTKKKYKPKKRKQDKIYRENNKEKRNIKEAERKRNDPKYRLTCNIRKLVNLTFKRKGYSKESRTNEILGCSFEEFKEHIESQWEVWMNWDNYGKYNGEENYGWDIDHIKPLVLAESEEDVVELNHYTNLQPLCSYVNRYVKKDKFMPI